MKFRYAAIAVFAFALGVLVRDQAQDFTPQAKACEAVRENAERLAAAVTAALNGGAFQTDDIRVSCRVVPIRKERFL